ncbi:MAG: DNA topology modulation protein FlaR [Pseudomonadota bacterium]
MRRVMVIGGSGAGKSTFARGLGARLALPVVHLDQLFWEPGWVAADEAVFLARVEAAVAGEAWVIEGNYSRTWPMRLARADTVIFLDEPAWRRFWRILRRIARGYGQSRPDMAPGCPERIDLGFLFGWVPAYGRRGRPKALALMAGEGPCGRHRLSGPREVANFLAGLPSEVRAVRPR